MARAASPVVGDRDQGHLPTVSVGTLPVCAEGIRNAPTVKGGVRAPESRGLGSPANQSANMRGPREGLLRQGVVPPPLGFFLAQRVWAAFLEISDLLSADKMAALLRPPFRAPRFPSATAWTFFFRAMSIDYACPAKKSSSFFLLTMRSRASIIKA